MPAVRGADMHQQPPSPHIPNKKPFSGPYTHAAYHTASAHPEIHADPARFITGQQMFNESLTERAGAAGDEDAFAIKHENDS